MATFVIPGLRPYGAVELKKNLQKYSTIGMAIAGAVHFSLVGLYWGSTSVGKEEAPPQRVVKIVKYSELGPPPSISSSAVAPAVSVGGPVGKPSVGIPGPVPDAEVSPEQSFASQTELSQQIGPITETATGAGGFAQIEQDIQVDDEPPPAFVPFEKEPVCIRRVEPTYPDIAQKAGLEGKVIAYLWVDKQGKVRDVKIVKSDSEIFNQAVVDAAKQYQFTPAMMKNGPVSVWISVPFSFELK